MGAGLEDPPQPARQVRATPLAKIENNGHEFNFFILVFLWLLNDVLKLTPVSFEEQGVGRSLECTFLNELKMQGCKKEGYFQINCLQSPPSR